MNYGCIGERLSHSFSKEIHEAFAPYSYELLELKPEEVGTFLSSRAFSGINVTIPYKETVIPHLDVIDESAKEIGAVNTVVNREGKLYGYNTDFYGMRALLRHADIALTGKKVAILGTGGTSKTARAVSRSLGAEKIIVVSRTAREGVIDYQTLLDFHTDTEVIINTTPLGMYPNLDAMATDPANFPNLIGVIDAVYNPLASELILKARACGLKAEGGLYMLVAQAVRASEIFLDTTFSSDTLETVYQQILKRKENIVLVGMPASGKSTVGAMLAKKLGRKFLDTDTLFEEHTGCSPHDYLIQYGEAAFRALECDVVREVAKQGGIVLATGGGVILRKENVKNIHHNGRVYWLDRPLDELIPTASRPLSSDREALARRYAERVDKYRLSADVILSGSHSAEEFTEMILEDFQK